MNKVAKTAFGGLMIALSVVLLVPTVLDIFVYALPAMAGLITMLCVIELDKKWALGVYFGASVVSLLLVPNKEAAVLYFAFFGYYPIVKALLESKNMNRIVEYIIKFAIFNASVILAYLALIKLFGMPFDELMGISDDSSSFFKTYALPIMLVGGNIMFILYDICLNRIATVYIKLWQKHFRKLFRF